MGERGGKEKAPAYENGVGKSAYTWLRALLETLFGDEVRSNVFFAKLCDKTIILAHLLLPEKVFVLFFIFLHLLSLRSP